MGAANDLRYAVGVILASGTEVPDPAELEAVTKQGYKIVHFPKPNYVVLAEFPFTNTLSIYMGIFRVYPKLKEYIATHGLCLSSFRNLFFKQNQIHDAFIKTRRFLCAR